MDGTGSGTGRPKAAGSKRARQEIGADQRQQRLSFGRGGMQLVAAPPAAAVTVPAAAAGAAVTAPAAGAPAAGAPAATVEEGIEASRDPKRAKKNKRVSQTVIDS